MLWADTGSAFQGPCTTAVDRADCSESSFHERNPLAEPLLQSRAWQRGPGYVSTHARKPAWRKQETAESVCHGPYLRNATCICSSPSARLLTSASGWLIGWLGAGGAGRVSGRHHRPRRRLLPLRKGTSVSRSDSRACLCSQQRARERRDEEQRPRRAQMSGCNTMPNEAEGGDTLGGSGLQDLVLLEHRIELNTSLPKGSTQHFVVGNLYVHTAWTRSSGKKSERP